MIIMGVEITNSYSPWWARIIAIVIGIMVLTSIASVFYLEIFGIGGIDQYSFDNEPENPGDYPQNGSSGEQENYNWSLREWENYLSYQLMIEDLEESYVKEIAQITALVTVLIGIPTIAMFWTQHQKMLISGVAFGTTKIIGDMWVSSLSSEIVGKYMDSVPGGGDYSWIAKTSVMTSSLCGIFLIGLAIVLSKMYNQSAENPEGGLHLQLELLPKSPDDQENDTL